MADDGNKVGKNVWALPKFSFTLEMAGRTASFQEATGLDIETQPIEFRGGDSKVFSKVKLPGLRKYGNVTLKKGVFKGDASLWDWFKDIRMDTTKRDDVKIRLLDEAGGTAMIWTLKNAFAAKISGIDLKSEGSEVAVETIELAHDGIVIEKA